MQIEDVPDPAMIDGDLVTGLDDACQFTGGEGVRKGETDDLLLDMHRHTGFDGGRAARMGQGAVIQETDDARALKAPQIPP